MRNFAALTCALGTDFNNNAPGKHVFLSARTVCFVNIHMHGTGGQCVDQRTLTYSHMSDNLSSGVFTPPFGGIMGDF